LRILLTSLLVVILDQSAKLLVKGISVPVFNLYLNGIPLGDEKKLLDSFLYITFVENPGIAFGIEFNNILRITIVLFNIIIIGGLIFFLLKKKKLKFGIWFSFALILGGAVGNMIDRIFYGLVFNYAPVFLGRVVDYIRIKTFTFSLFGRNYDSLPTFNLADLAISCGMILLIISTNFFNEEKLKQNNIWMTK